MTSSRKNIFQFLIGFGLGGGLLYLAFRNINFAELRTTLEQADPFWVTVGVLISAFSHWLRGARWQMLLEASGYKVSKANTFAATMVGYLTNLAIPRLGELTRCSTLIRTNGVPFVVNVGTVVSERVIDILTLGLLLLTLLLFEFQNLTQLFSNFLPANKGLFFIIAATLGVTVIGLGWKFKEKVLATSVGQKIAELISAALSIRKLKKLPLFLAYSVGIWFCYIAITYAVFLSLAETAGLGFYFAIVVTAIGAVGMTIPSPGGLGTYHTAFKQTFILFGLSGKTGVAIALLIHTPGVLMTVCLGAASYFYLLFQKPAETKNNLKS